jgi:CRP-like cAMP-binding protein
MDWSDLRALPLFASLRKRELKHFAPLVEEIDVESGRQLVQQGEIAHELFVIQEGTADVSRDGDVIGSLGPGDFFGEIALHDESRRRTSSVVATSPMRLAVLQGHEVRAIEREHPEVAGVLQSAISAHLTADAQR